MAVSEVVLLPFLAHSTLNSDFCGFNISRHYVGYKILPHRYLNSLVSASKADLGFFLKVQE